MPTSTAATTALLLLVALLGLTVAGAAGEEAGADVKPLPIHIEFKEEVQVRLVMVPVSVFDNRRRPVLDLVEEDFTILVDGELVPIVSFDATFIDEITSGKKEKASRRNGKTDGRQPDTVLPEQQAPAAGPGTETPATAPPVSSIHVAVVIDVYQTRLSRTAAAFGAVEKMLGSEPPPGTRIGLFLITHGRIKTVLPFTDDGDALLAALQAAYEDVGNRDTWVTDEPSRGIWTDCGLIGSLSREQARRVRHVLTSLRGLSAAMDQLAGRKSMVLVSDGIRARAGTNYAAQPKEKALCTTSLWPEMNRLARELGEAGISLSPVSLLGMTQPGKRDHFSDDDGELLATGSFLADATGGRRPVHLNDFAREVEVAVQQPLHQYVLGIRPDNPGPDGKEHRIEVQVSRKRTSATFRTGYVDGFSGLGKESVLAGAALFPDEFKAVAVTGARRTLPACGGPDELHLQLTLDPYSMAWLPASEEKARGEIEITAILDDGRGNRRQLFGSIYEISVPRGRPPARLILQEAVPLHVMHASTLIVVAYDSIAGVAGTWVTEIPATARRRDQIRISAPVLMQADPLAHLLTPSGEPLLGREMDDQLLLPVRRGLAPGVPHLAMARVENLPPGGAVRFCLATKEETESCVAGGLETMECPSNVNAGSDADGPRLVTAWTALGESVTAPESIRAEVVTADGQVVATGRRTAADE